MFVGDRWVSLRMYSGDYLIGVSRNVPHSPRKSMARSRQWLYETAGNSVYFSRHGGGSCLVYI